MTQTLINTDVLQTLRVKADAADQLIPRLSRSTETLAKAMAIIQSLLQLRDLLALVVDYLEDQDVQPPWLPQIKRTLELMDGKP